MDVVYLDFSQAFGTVSSHIIVVKSVKYRLDKWTVRWWKISWIGGLKGGITAVQSTCYVVSSVIPRGVRLGPVLFSVLLIT